MNKGEKMKIRNGFVSNSSTTSFCICGFSVKENWPQFLQHQDKKRSETASKLDSYHCEDAEVSYYGLAIEEMKDDETLQQFKDRTKSLCKEIFGDAIKDVDFRIIVEGWSNY